MTDALFPTEVARLRSERGLKIDELADLLGCKKGHASDLCTGRRSVTQKVAVRLEAISGRPWHEWMPKQQGEAA